MSSDNFYYVQRHPEGHWTATMGFASDDTLPFADRTDPEFMTVVDALDYALAQYSEYGVQMSDAARAELGPPTTGAELRAKYSK